MQLTQPAELCARAGAAAVRLERPAGETTRRQDRRRRSRRQVKQVRQTASTLLHLHSLKDFIAALEGNAEVAALRADVEAFASAFPMPGFSFDATLLGV